MPSPAPIIRIGIYGFDDNPNNERHGCGLWPAGYSSCVTAAGGTPIPLEEAANDSLDEVLETLQGVVLAARDGRGHRQADEVEWVIEWCKKHHLPLLAIDHGLHALNAVFGGTLHFDLPKELPEALQHRQPPERGLRHAMNVIAGTRLAGIYGEGEVVVNSEHRRAVARVARGFTVGAHALDGVVEAIEAQSENWFAVGVQWHPASPTASGLDIQLFRGLVDATTIGRKQAKPARAAMAAA
jgi:putative glutamine amidotransferase